MIERIYSITKQNIGESMTWLENTLKEFNVNSQEFLFSMHVVEELFEQLHITAGYKQNFVTEMRVRKRLRKVDIVLSCDSDKSFMLRHLDEIGSDDADYPRLAILNAYRKHLRIYRRTHKNIVKIKLYDSEKKRIRDTLIGLVAGALLGSLIYVVVKDHDKIALIEDTVLTSAQTMFLNALILVAAPQIFFSVLSGLINISSTTLFGRAGKKLILYSLPKYSLYVLLGLLVGNIIGDIEQIPIMMAKDMGIVNKNVIKDMIVNIIPGDIVTPFHTSNVLQLLFIACVSGLLVMVVGKLSPFSFMRKIIRFIPLPFSLSNSTACMPAEMVFCHDELGMDDKFAKFSIPLGMQINMDGTAYYVAVVSMVLAHTFKVDMNIQFLFSFYISLLIVNISGMGLIAMPSIYKGFGMPNIAVTMVIGIEPVLDMFGTAQSVVGNITSAFLACRKENSVDESVYYRK